MMENEHTISCLMRNNALIQGINDTIYHGNKNYFAAGFSPWTSSTIPIRFGDIFANRDILEIRGDVPIASDVNRKCKNGDKTIRPLYKKNEPYVKPEIN
ncbi:MAG: hypothetical protein IH947_04330 [Bacteroidetes bacterium]|nr:hypothetical protein [Bacteroidota bacterium]